MRLSAKIIVWSAAGLIVAGFLQPWARLELVKETKAEKGIASGVQRGAKKAFGGAKPKENFWAKKQKQTGKDAAMIPTRVRGYEVPILANRKSGKVAAGLIKMFTKKDEQIGLKSWLVYAIPGLALVCAWLVGQLGRRHAVLIAVAVIGLAIGAGGFWVMATTDTRKEFSIAIGEGLWMTFFGFVLMALGALSGLLPPSLSQRLAGVLQKLLPRKPVL
jgi:hypothetical protein